jgi:hypothetical protein
LWKARRWTHRCRCGKTGSTSPSWPAPTKSPTSIPAWPQEKL